MSSARRSSASLGGRLVLELTALGGVERSVLLEQHPVRGRDGLLRYRFSRGAVVTALGDLAQPPPEWERLSVPTLLEDAFAEGTRRELDGQLPSRVLTVEDGVHLDHIE